MIYCYFLANLNTPLLILNSSLDQNVKSEGYLLRCIVTMTLLYVSVKIL